MRGGKKYREEEGTNVQCRCTNIVDGGNVFHIIIH